MEFAIAPEGSLFGLVSMCEGAGAAQGNCDENLLGALKNRIHTVSGVTVILNGR